MGKHIENIMISTKDALMDMLKDIEQHHFLICHTTSGAIAIVFSRKGGGDKPLLGAYFTGDEWIPAKWTETGCFINETVPRTLDLDFSQHTNIDPITPLAA